MAFIINIQSMITPVQDSRANRGMTETVTDPAQIEEYLTDSECFTDDEIFVADTGIEYTIDDLIDEQVSVQGRHPILVQD